MAAALALGGIVMVMTSLVAVRIAIAVECLTVEIATAKRVTVRIPTGQHLAETLRADRALLNDALARAHSVLCAALQPRVHGLLALNFGPLRLPELGVAASATHEIVPTVQLAEQQPGCNLAVACCAAAARARRTVR